ncbi:MAG: RNase adapter RapZ [Deferribacteres bacterium]|nr:RNase adapter RapZ [Deferribacteres bacterium]
MKKAQKSGRPLIIILTGLSGSGKTVALNAFEDSGFFCVDNLPVALIETFLDLTRDMPKIAIGMDIREREFLTDFSEIISGLKKDRKIEIIFLEASEEVIIRRFKETRRPHPLAYRDLSRAIRKEAKLLEPIRREADEIIDTSSLNPHELRRFITESYLKNRTRKMSIRLISFGYKYGMPPEADLLFDVRFLPNPYFIEKYREFPGTSGRVKKFVLSQEDTKEFLERLMPLLLYLIPLYKQEGRTYLTIGFGCTGGRHRSPAVSEEVRKRLKKHKLDVSITHRDLHCSSS